MKRVVNISLVLMLMFANIVLAFADTNPDDGEDKVRCFNGGVGASHCSIAAGIDVFGLGLSSDCSVDCREGYYACCGLRCVCKREITEE